MAFNFNTALTSAFSAIPTQTGPSGQGLPLYQTVMNSLKAGQTPAATPVASVPYQAPNQTVQPIEQTPFTIAGMGAWFKNNPLATGGILLVVGFIVWRAVK